MRKNIVFACFVSWAPNRRFEGFQFAEPAAAVKVVDHGTKYRYNDLDGPFKITWKTYQYNNNFLKTYTIYYTKTKYTAAKYYWRIFRHLCVTQ